MDYTKIKPQYRPDYERKWAQDALDVQDASNIVGVTNSFCDMLRVMRIGFMVDEPGVRKHPAVILFMNKLDSMVGHVDKGLAFSDAYAECTKVAGR